MKTRLWTPNDIEVLIHCHVFAAPHPRADAPAVQDAVKKLFAYGLILQDKNDRAKWSTTPRGEALMESLCRVSLPEKKTVWADADGNPLGAFEGVRA